jgi:hypothetical protein
MVKIINWFGVLLMLAFCSCQKDHMFDCFKGTGIDKSEVRNISGFSRIKASNNVDVKIYPGHDYKVEVKAGSKLIDGITTEVKDSMLYIRNENACNWVRSFKNKFTVSVWMPDIAELTVNGSGNIDLMDTIRHNEFTFNNWGASGKVTFLFNTGAVRTNIHTGPGDFVFHGYVGVHYFYNNGNGIADASNLNTEVTFTENKGANKEYVRAKQWLTAKISYVGDIYYFGNPDSVVREGTGNGKLIKAD